MGKPGYQLRERSAVPGGVRSWRTTDSGAAAGGPDGFERDLNVQVTMRLAFKLIRGPRSRQNASMSTRSASFACRPVDRD